MKCVVDNLKPDSWSSETRSSKSVFFFSRLSLALFHKLFLSDFNTASYLQDTFCEKGVCVCLCECDWQASGK